MRTTQPIDKSGADGGIRQVIRFNAAMTVISVGVAALVAWAVSMIPDTTDMKVLAAVIAGVMALVYLSTLSNVGGTRSATVIRATSWTALFVTLPVVIIMAIWCTTPSYLIITASLILLIYAAVIIAVARSGQ